MYYVMKITKSLIIFTASNGKILIDYSIFRFIRVILLIQNE